MTASYTVLPDIWKCKEFVNADEIAKGLSPFNPESVTIEAGKIMLQRISAATVSTDVAFPSVFKRTFLVGEQNYSFAI